MMTTCRLLCALLVLALCCCPSVCMAEGDEDQVSELSLESNPNGTIDTDRKVQTSITSSDPGKEGSRVPDQLEDQNTKSPTPTIEQEQDGAGGSGGSRSSGTVEGTPGNAEKNAEQVHDTPGLEEAPSKSELKVQAKTVQEQVQISGTVVSGLSSQSSNGQTQSGKPASQGSSRTADPLEGTDTESPESTTERGQGEAGGSGSPGAGAGTPGIPGDDAVQSHITPGLGLTAGPAKGNGQESGTASNTSESAGLPKTVQDPATSEATGADQANDLADPLKEPDTTTKTTTTTTTTGAPSRLPEIDGSLSSSAWVCAPLLLTVSALAYTTLG
ncbi:mucin TcMUCII, putative [Trypanosoma cruzi marinkellei]|uniref:Mucin TcMUCII, putative n=1 Tax=Trypanosoma cruzi marinkellei TaxID=85056 RepID=K2NIP9_TRYCR|nr:mucin TcMUCII, putative [Trypanosoma cruzi marinkellei]